MSDISLVKIFIRELFSQSRLERVTEPALVMEDPQQVIEYTTAGLEGGVMAPMYLFHTAQVCEILCPGDNVLDLACGPANQLAQIARLNPGCNFVGLDLSSEMLGKAKCLIQSQGLLNITFAEGSITDLSRYDDKSFDAVMSTMALHHLPDVEALNQTYREACRVLKQGGGVYLADFGRLKRKDSIEYFAHQYQDRQPPLFTVDYLNSLLAAFSLQDFRSACSQSFGNHATVKSTWCVPYLVVTKTIPRRKLTNELVNGIIRLRNALPPHHKSDLADLLMFTRLGGLSSQALAKK